MTQVLRFLVVLELLALAGAPLAARALGRLPGAGLAFGRVLALLLVGWVVWLAGSAGIPNGIGLALAGAAVVAAGAVAAWRLGPALRPDAFARRLLAGSEAVFLATFALAALLISFAPDVWGTEKPMDMMLINATLASSDVPPHDPWLAGEQVNYYYLGHLMAGLLVRFTGVEPTEGYNLALATVAALTASVTFALTATLAEAGRRQGLPVRRPLATGALAVVLLAVMGNVRGGWEAVTHSGPVAGFGWFDASRVIPGTINEFPLFSLLVGDLHAHLIAVPLTLLALAFAAQAALSGPPALRSRQGRWETLCAALAVGILYAVNSWSWPVAAGLLVLALAVWAAGEDGAGRRREAAPWGVATVALGLLLVWPFIAGFDPNARGFGWVETADREPLEDFLVHLMVTYGALLWLLVAPFAGRMAAARHPVRVLVWGTAIVAVALSLTATSRLAGAAILALLAVVALVAALRRTGPPVERLVWGLAAAALVLLAGPEVAYVRDEFDGTEFTRMNTVFKLGYQAWLLFAVAGALVVAMARVWLGRRTRAAWLAAGLALVGVSLAYAPLGAAGSTAGFADGPRLDGRQWLASTAPGDVAAIDWIRGELAGDATILEAVGDDYSAFGNGRISTYTGRPTVLGWEGHEVQWSHDVGTRRADVETLYTTRDPQLARTLLALYGVRYAVVGPLERTSYGPPGVLTTLGRPVFERRGTTVYAF